MAYALSIGAKINDLGWPWMADMHSIAEKMRLSEPTTKIWMGTTKQSSTWGFSRLTTKTYSHRSLSELSPHSALTNTYRKIDGYSNSSTVGRRHSTPQEDIDRNDVVDTARLLRTLSKIATLYWAVRKEHYFSSRVDCCFLWFFCFVVAANKQ